MPIVIGRSHIVGRPMSILMSQKGEASNCTVTLTHSRTKNMEELTLQADIIVSALGVPHFLKADMVKQGAVIIDVGITRVPDESKKTRLLSGRGCRFRGGRKKGILHYAGPGWGRAHDHRYAAKKYTFGPGAAPKPELIVLFFRSPIVSS